MHEHFCLIIEGFALKLFQELLHDVKRGTLKEWITWELHM